MGIGSLRGGLWDTTVGTFTWGHVPAFALAIFRRDSHGRCRAMARGTIHGDDFSMDLHIAFAQALPPRDWLLTVRGGKLVGFVATDAWSGWPSKDFALLDADGPPTSTRQRRAESRPQR